MVSYLKSKRLIGRLITVLICSIPLQLVSQAVKAEALTVSITASVVRGAPETTQRILRALDNTGYEVNLVVLPNKRSITELRRGEVALEFFRTPSVTASMPELIRLEPLVQSLNFNMITSIRSADNCLATEEQYRELSMAGVLGVGLHQIDFYPKFKNTSTLNDLPSLLKFVALQRADVTFLPNEIMDFIPPEVSRDLIVCPANYKTFPFYAHLHKDYAWAREAVEAALRAEFAINKDVIASD